MQHHKRFFPFIMLIALVTACTEQPVTPKPRAYPKVEYPERGTQEFSNTDCPFTFQYPSYARIEQDSQFLNREVQAGSCWFDLYIPDFDSRLYCSFYRIGEKKSLEELKADAFEMADYHTKRANYIEESVIDLGPERKGILFTMEGPAATPFQYYLTDEEDYFFRASLYFNAKVNPDSIAPIYQFIREDMMKMIETFEWNAS